MGKGFKLGNRAIYIISLFLIWGSYIAGWLIGWILDSGMFGFCMVIVTISMVPLMMTGAAKDRYIKSKI